MSDTAVTPLLPYAIARAFKPKEVFGEPKRLLKTFPTNSEGDTMDGHYAAMGHVFGKIGAVMVSQRPNRDGGVDRSYGLKGTFEAIPADRKRNPIRTSTAWFPTHIHDAIAVLLREFDPVNGEIREDGALEVDVSFEVGIKSNSKSSTGFTWEYKPLMEMKTNSDPLASLRGSLPVGLLPAPEARGPTPEPEPVEDPAPEGGDDEGAAEAPEPEPAKAPAAKGGKGHR